MWEKVCSEKSVLGNFSEIKTYQKLQISVKVILCKVK